MIQNRFINRRVQNSHKRRLRPIYSKKTSSYEEVLKKDASVSIRYKKILSNIAVEMFKIKNDMSSANVSSFLFWTRNHNNLRQP